jgi:hypothetical protein
MAEFGVPESVEIIGAHCFESCSHIKTITLERSSRLKRIGERTFAGCNLLNSITIPASTEEIDGSAFVNCHLIEIRVSSESKNFKVEGNLLVTFDGTEIVRYFGLDQTVIVGKKVKIIGKSSFEGYKSLEQMEFETGSELERIGAAALRGCSSLVSIEIPRSVQIVEENSFEGCTELESCFFGEDSSLVTIGVRAFAKCISLRSFSIPRQVAGIGSQCFGECDYLCRLMFGSSESLKRVVGDRSLDEALDEFGVSGHSSLFKIDVEDRGGELNIVGWVLVDGGEGASHLRLVRDLQ